jgi:hypothetical protein
MLVHAGALDMAADTARTRPHGRLRGILIGLGSVATGAVPLVAQVVDASTIVVPSVYEESDAPAANGFPFGATPTNPGGFTSQRYQQVYRADEFPDGAIVISEIAVRRDFSAGGPVTSITNSSVEILLSTTPSAPDELSVVFAENVGADVTAVFSGTITFMGPATPPESGVFDFEFTIVFDAAFQYDPSAGNLLLEVRNHELATGSILFDAVNVADDSVSRVFTSTGGSASSSSGIADSRGLVTRFSYLPVAEPGALGLLAIGIVGLVLQRAWQGQRIR